MKLKMVLVAIGLIAGSAGVHANETSPHWEYKGKAGATHWGDLEQDYASCKLGKEQSPIDIHGAKKAKLDPIGFHYTAGDAEVVNNGHTVQVNLAAGGTINLSDGEYKLLQFHFHTPSEEKINGKNYPLVAHLVHKNAAGNLAVVAVLFKVGKENAALKQVFASLPAKAGDKQPLEGGIDLTSVLPSEQGYYAFKGSLTTPPCSEGVRWQVLKTVSEISAKQLATFKKLYPMNARPVQPLNGREIQVSE
jgi:carbonic anhydrase